MPSIYEDFFHGKKITLMGLGLLGRGVGDAAFIAECGGHVTVTDLKTEDELSESLEKLNPYADIDYALGQHCIEDFQNCDMVIKAAGVPLDSPYIQAAKDHNVPVYMSTALFAKFSPATIVGVTGTRGKSTTAQMIYEGLKVAGKKVHLGGNIRGLSTLAMLPDVGPDDIVVLELDSWQLQGFRDLDISPYIAVFTNFMPDHMNYYKDDMDLYFHDKAGIFSAQSEDDFVIAGPDIAPKIKSASKLITAPALPNDWQVGVPGEHNRLNAALAWEALRLLGVAEGQAKQALAGFSGLEGRLNLVAEINGVKIYNDSNATTPQAACAALHSFEKGKILLIAGGTDKNLDLTDLAAAISARCREAVFLDGNGTQRLSKLLPDVAVFDNLKKAFDTVVGKAQAGDIILFSPGFTSFGMFKNEYDRGDQFTALVKDYERGTL